MATLHFIELRLTVVLLALLLWPSLASAQIIVSDSFTAPDGTRLTAHVPEVSPTGQPWIVSSAPVPAISAGRVTSGAGTGHLQAVLETGLADVVLGVTYHVGTGPGMGALVFRYADPANFLLLETYQGRLELYRRQAGAYTALASVPVNGIVPGSTHRLELRARGPLIQAGWDGVLVIDVMDAFQQGATKHGIDWNTAYDATTSYDAFTITSEAAVVAPPAVTCTPSPFEILVWGTLGANVVQIPPVPAGEVWTITEGGLVTNVPDFPPGREWAMEKISPILIGYRHALAKIVGAQQTPLLALNHVTVLKAGEYVTGRTVGMGPSQNFGISVIGTRVLASCP